MHLISQKSLLLWKTMIIEQGYKAVKRRSDSILTVGTFDGVHLGHRMIIQDMIRRAEETGGLSTLITFDPHPREVLFQQSLPKLTTIDERAEILSSLGLCRMVVLPFTKSFSRLNAERFVTDLLVGSVGLQTIVIGHDHRFGAGRTGDVDLLISMGKRYHFDVIVVSPFQMENLVVSSRKIRSVLQQDGDVSLAEKLMARPYSLAGKVIHGDGRGRELGYPTANLALLSENKVVPAHGIYVVRAQVSGRHYGGMMSIGVRPAIKDSQGVHLEVHLFDFDGMIYGKELRVQFLDRIREERNFDSLADMQEMMRQDEKHSKHILEQSPQHRI